MIILILLILVTHNLFLIFKIYKTITEYNILKKQYLEELEEMNNNLQKYL